MGLTMSAASVSRLTAPPTRITKYVNGSSACVVHRRHLGLAQPRPHRVAHPLVEVDGDVPAVQRQQRKQVEHADEEVQQGQQEHEVLPQPALGRVAADDRRPTTLTGVFSSRSPPPSAFHSAGIRSGNDRMPCQTLRTSGR
jgi:hypothetical protein